MPAATAKMRPPESFAIDLDGVVWLSREPIDGSIEALGRLRAGDRPLVFITNDPRSTRAELAARLTELGAPTGPDEVLTSGAAAAAAVATAQPGARVLAVGTESLAEELAARGLVSVALGEAADAVVVGGGGRFDFEVLRIASGLVREGAALWATNKDPTYPTARGLVPGTGAVVAAIEVAAGVEARTVGKPEPALFREALELLGTRSALMAGDSLHSDIAGAAAAGMATALILTGRDAEADIAAAPVAPDLVCADLAALADSLAEASR